MSEFKIGQDAFWFTGEIESAPVVRVDGAEALIDRYGFALRKPGLFPTREALAKHLFPELFKSPWKKTSDNKPVIGESVIGDFGVNFKVVSLDDSENWVDDEGFIVGPPHEWMYIPE